MFNLSFNTIIIYVFIFDLLFIVIWIVLIDVVWQFYHLILFILYYVYVYLGNILLILISLIFCFMYRSFCIRVRLYWKHLFFFFLSVGFMCTVLLHDSKIICIFLFRNGRFLYQAGEKDRWPSACVCVCVCVYVVVWVCTLIEWSVLSQSYVTMVVEMVMYHCVCTTVLCCVVVCRVCNKDLVT